MASQRGAKVLGFPLAATLQPEAQAGGPVQDYPTSNCPNPTPPAPRAPRRLSPAHCSLGSSTHPPLPSQTTQDPSSSPTLPASGPSQLPATTSGFHPKTPIGGRKPGLGAAFRGRRSAGKSHSPAHRQFRDRQPAE